MPRSGVSVRIRGRGETTLEAEFHDAETVGEFKRRVFGEQLEEDRQCRLIARGKELRDSREMGSYSIEEGSCLHVMIGPQGSGVRPTASASGDDGDATPSRGGPMGEATGFAVLCSLTLGLLIGIWTLYMLWPELFSTMAIVILLLLTYLQCVMMLPLLRKAVQTAVVAYRSQSALFRRSSVAPRR